MPEDGARRYAGDVTPEEAWDILKTDKSAELNDCRTDAEWSYVGQTDLSGIRKEQLNIAWKDFPTMEINPSFAEEIAAACPDKQTKLLIMCRSGLRSIDAAIAAVLVIVAHAVIFVCIVVIDVLILVLVFSVAVIVIVAAVVRVVNAVPFKDVHLPC